MPYPRHDPKRVCDHPDTLGSVDAVLLSLGVAWLIWSGGNTVATNFPGSLDNRTKPTSEQLRSTSGALLTEIVGDLIDMVQACEAKIGVVDSAVATSHDDRIKQLEGSGSATLAEGDAIDIMEVSGAVTISSLPMVVRFNLSSGAVIVSGTTPSDWPNSQRRTKLDLTYAKQVRIIVRTSNPAAASGATIAFQYSTDDRTYTYMDGNSGPAVTVDVANSTRVSSWVKLTSGAKADVFIRLVGHSGDGTTSITLGTIELQVH
jgi:hypothetical protein